MGNLFNTYLYEPILNLLILIYNALPIEDIGIAIIIITVIIRLALWPLQKKQIQAQKKMKELQPKMSEINKKYKGDAQKRGQEMMKLYKKHNANPASSCLPLLVQLPILWAVFRVFRDGFKIETMEKLYSFVANPGIIDPFFLNIAYFDLSQPNIALTLITAIVQFWQSKMLMGSKQEEKPKNDNERPSMQETINKQMIYLMPIITIVIGMQLPSGLMLYWLVSTLLLGLQQVWILRKEKLNV